MNDDDDDLRREEYGARVRDLTERFACDIDEGHYNPYEATQALIVLTAVLCVDDKHFRNLIGLLASTWNDVVVSRENGEEEEDEE